MSIPFFANDTTPFSASFTNLIILFGKTCLIFFDLFLTIAIFRFKNSEAFFIIYVFYFFC